jgi:chorismate mutase/prephenate dehydratase
MSIRNWRRKIDAIDRRLVRLLNQRAECSLAISWLKHDAGQRLFHRKREREIAGNVRRANCGPLPDRAIEHLFEEILRATRTAVRASLRKERGAPAPGRRKRS